MPLDSVLTCSQSHSSKVIRKVEGKGHYCAAPQTSRAQRRLFRSLSAGRRDYAHHLCHSPRDLFKRQLYVVVVQEVHSADRHRSPIVSPVSAEGHFCGWHSRTYDPRMVTIHPLLVRRSPNVRELEGDGVKP